MNVFGWPEKRAFNKSLRELHEALDEGGFGERWIRRTARELTKESAAIDAILKERVLRFPPKTSQMELCRRFGMKRDRLRVIEGWLVRRIRGRMRYQVQKRAN